MRKPYPKPFKVLTKTSFYMPLFSCQGCIIRTALRRKKMKDEEKDEEDPNEQDPDATQSSPPSATAMRRPTKVDAWAR